MNENKREKKKQIRRLKKTLKYLIKLKNLGYSSSYVLIDWLISETKQDLRLYGVEVEE